MSASRLGSPMSHSTDPLIRPRPPVSRHTAAAGGIVFDADRRLLVIRRGHEPSAGLWSVPGGRCLVGESPATACVREVAEETGLAVRVIRHAGRVERPGSGDAAIYDIDDFVCELVDATAADTLEPESDAREAQWVTRSQLRTLDLVPLLWEALAGWDCLPN